MIKLTDKQKETLRAYDAQINQIVAVKRVFLSAILQGSKVDEKDTYQLDEDYNLVKQK